MRGWMFIGSCECALLYVCYATLLLGGGLGGQEAGKRLTGVDWQVLRGRGEQCVLLGCG